MAVLLVVALASMPGTARSQDVSADPLYLPKLPTLGSTRVVALGGAYTGVAEGAQGLSANLASIAHRAPNLDNYWDWGLTLSILSAPFLDDSERDLDNDGRADNAVTALSMLTGGFYQYRYFGVGGYVNLRSEEYCLSDGCLDSVIYDETTGLIATAVALGDDAFVAGLGLYISDTRLRYENITWAYQDLAFEFDVLYRPLGRPWRFGVSVKPQVVAPLSQTNIPNIPLIRPVHTRVVVPSLLSIGVSFRLGHGAYNYNRLSPVARRDFITRYGVDKAPPEHAPLDPIGRWLVTTQLDVSGAVAAAVPLSQVVAREPGAAIPGSVGDHILFTPRIGVEHDTVVDRLRLRLGSYLEPSAFSSTRFRPHITGGAELMLFHYWQKWSVSGAFDAASQYANAGITVGFWE